MKKRAPTPRQKLIELLWGEFVVDKTAAQLNNMKRTNSYRNPLCEQDPNDDDMVAFVEYIAHKNGLIQWYRELTDSQYVRIVKQAQNRFPQARSLR